LHIPELGEATPLLKFSGRAIRRAEDLVGDSCARFKVIGLSSLRQIENFADALEAKV